MQSELGDRSLLFRQIGQNSIATCLSWTEALRLWSLRKFRRGFEVWALTSAVAIAASGPSPVTFAAAVTTSLTLALAVLAITTVTLGARFNHLLEWLTARQKLDGAAAAAVLLTALDDRQHIDGVHHLLDLDLQHVADYRAIWEERSGQYSIWFSRACGAPRPRAVRERARQLYFNPARHSSNGTLSEPENFIENMDST